MRGNVRGKKCILRENTGSKAFPRESMLTEAQIRTISAEKKKRIHDGSGLYLELRPLRTGGTGKYFIGRTRYPLGGPMVDVTVGSWERERDPGQLSLKAARNEWTQLKAWALAEGKDPRDRDGTRR